MSLFSTLVQDIKTKPSSTKYHLIDHEYFATFNSLDDMQQFHKTLNANQTIHNTYENEDTLLIEHDDSDMDMKAFAQQFLIDPVQSSSPRHSEHSSNDSLTIQNQKRKESMLDDVNHDQSCKKQRRTVQDSSWSNSVSLASDDDDENIFDSLIEIKSSSRTKRIAFEDISAILLTLDVKKPTKKKSKYQEPTIAIEMAEPSLIKIEPIEQEQLVVSHIVDSQSKPVQINIIPTIPMRFGTSEYTDDLDSYVKNIHRSCSTNVSVAQHVPLRPKRIRKQKRFYAEEECTDSGIPRKQTRKKRTQTSINGTQLTDAEIEKNFGERLFPAIKLERYEVPRALGLNPIIIETQSLPQTPIEKARANLMQALGRGHGPDKVVVKVRSRENRIIEIELAIYSTTDWYSRRTKILSKIEETFRGLRVNWTKIDIQVDEFDVEVSTSFRHHCPTASSSSTTNMMNSLWFLKLLRESGPVLVHIHNRQNPQQRHLIQCPCSQCSFHEQTIEPSLPVIVNVSSAKTAMPNRQQCYPTILRRTSSLSPTKSSLLNINTKFFQDLIFEYGTTTVSSVTQCVLDLALIVSVHSSLPYLLTLNHDYIKCYQQVIDPLKHSMNDIKNRTVSEHCPQPNISMFYRTIKKYKANIRDAQSMRSVISESTLRPSCETSYAIKPLPDCASPKLVVNQDSIVMNRFNKRNHFEISTSGIDIHNNHSNQNNHSNSNHTGNGMKKQAHFTPIIELTPILGGTTNLDSRSSCESLTKSTKIISTNVIHKDSQRFNMITTQEITPRVIRLSINKPSLPINAVRLVTSSPNSTSSTVSTPLIPKQINIIKSLSSSIMPAIKLANPVLISSKSQRL